MLWQTVLALTHLMCAFALVDASRALNTKIFGTIPSPSFFFNGFIAAICWLVFPWSLGYSSWSIMLPPLISMYLTIVGVTVSLKKELGGSQIVVATALFATSWLIYESTWFVWLPIAAILLFIEWRDGGTLRQPLIFLVVCAATQSAFVAFNRMLSGSTHAKKFIKNVLPLLNTDVHLFNHQLIPALASGYDFLLGGGALLLISAVLCSVIQKKALSLLAATLCLLAGALIAVVLYAVAGYGVEWVGLFSRVTLPISLWLALLASLLAYPSAGTKPLAIVTGSAVLICAGSLGANLLVQTRYWQESWAQQIRVLEKLPSEIAEFARPDTVLLVQEPPFPAAGPVGTFSAFWDISGAIAGHFRTIHPLKIEAGRAVATVLRTGEWRTTWDGKMIRQYWCTAPNTVLWGIEAAYVYTWTYPDVHPQSVTRPYENVCPSK